MSREDQLRRIYEDEYERLVSFAWTLTQDVSAAQDAVQEGVSRVLRRLDDLRSDDALAAWVWKSVMWAAHDERRRAQERSAMPAGVLGAEAPVLPFPERDPVLAEALRELSPMRRLVVFLRYYADLSLADIAGVLGVSEKTVSATLTQARKALRTRLAAAEVAR